jgi:hypothetical protein
MARKKKRRSISTRNFSKVNIKLNIPWSDKGQGNKSFFKIVDRNPELKEYLTKESFEKLYNTEFEEFSKQKSPIETSDLFGDALSLLQGGNLTSEQIQAFLGTLLGQTTFGEITNFENPENSVGNSYVYAFGDGTPLYNPEFISNLQSQLDDLGISLEDLQDQLGERTDENLLLQSGSDSLGTQNSNLVEKNAALSGEVAALRAALALTPTFGINGVENTGLPTTELTGNLNTDGLPTQIILNCPMNNVTSKTITIYKITPEGNEGVGLNLNVIQNDSSGTPISNREVPATDGSIRIGNQGSDRNITMAFEPESVYIFEVTGENNAGIEDNESPKSLTKSAIFTTIDTDDSQITTLSTNLSDVTIERDTLSSQVADLQTDLTDKQTEVEGLTTDKNILENQKESAVNTLDGFSDNIVNKINALKSALEQEEVTDNTLEQVNSLIGTFNNFVPNINSNTPADTPVTQIQEFDRNLEVDTEDSSQLNPSTFPQFLGGDGITTQDNDNVLFDIESQLYSPWFDIPDLSYSSVPNELGIDEDNIQEKILVVVRPQRIKYLIGGLSYPYMLARGSASQVRFKSNTQMFSYETGMLYDYIESDETWFGQAGVESSTPILSPELGRRPNLTLTTKSQAGGQGSILYNTDIAVSGQRTSYKSDLLQGNNPRTAGNRNLMAISDYGNYDGNGYNGVYMLNGGNSFRLGINPSMIPYKQTILPGVGGTGVPLPTTHTYSVGLQFDFIVRKNNGSFVFKSRKVTGNFSFNISDLVG